MLTPPSSVVLAQQQHEYLTHQLPMFNFRLITGLDHVQFWSTNEIWDNVLQDIHVVVSTPQVLLDALTHAFVRMSSFSLLVFDEAHHCVAGEPPNRIMQTFYHPQRGQCEDLPHILGLTASPITRSNVKGLDRLEVNMNAICRAPTLQLAEYRQFVHLPQFITLEYFPSELPRIEALDCLDGIVHSMNLTTGLCITDHATQGSFGALGKGATKSSTALLKQVRQLQNHASELWEAVGAYAANTFLHECLSKLQSALMRRETLTWDYAQEEQKLLHEILTPVAELAATAVQNKKFNDQRSAKADVLVKFLLAYSKPGLCCVIFVKRRSTAWALQHVLSLCLPEYAVTSFVGTSNHVARKSTLIDLADIKGQWQGMASFRQGERNVCVATQVLEEGVDVQATNIVVRFDDPENVRSFIQSRGRARHASSQFVLLRDMTCSSSKYADWHRLEQEMKARYMDEKRQLEERLATEEMDEVDNRRYSVPSTGATLSPSVAVGHLVHFCQSSLCSTPGEGGSPEYIFTRDANLLVSARVMLPVSVHPDLRRYQSSKKWRSERSAKRDVSFLAYVNLHKAGLINDNLLPTSRHKVSSAASQESRESMCQIRAQFDAWRELHTLWDTAPSIHLHEVVVRSQDHHLPPVLLGLPETLAPHVQFPLYFTEAHDYMASIQPMGATLPSDQSLEQARTLTLDLLSPVLGRKFSNDIDWHGRLAYLIVPRPDGHVLKDWRHAARENDAKSVLIQQEGISIPFVVDTDDWTAGCAQARGTSEDVTEVTATRLTRRIEFLKKDRAFQPPQPKRVPVAECQKLELPVPFAQLALFLPAILFMTEVALRAQKVCRNILQPVNFQSTWLVAEALTLPAVHASINYERLEWIGDTLLKYYAALTVYCDKPLAPEGLLTVEVSHLTSNLRLHKAALALGIDEYITSIPFAGAQWKPTVYAQGSAEANPQRDISTKTTADVIESLLGAAYLDQEGLEQADNKAATFLQLALPEVQWLIPHKRLALTDNRDPKQNLRPDVQTMVEDLIGYHFKRPALVAEALNHSSVITKTASYQRLEFLGDAVLQRIVNMTLFKAPHAYEPGQLHLRQIACVNGNILAFLCLGLCHKAEHISVSTDPITQTTTVDTTFKDVGLWHFVAFGDNAGSRTDDCYDKYLALREEIWTQLDTGKAYPWKLLADLEAPKFLSDIVESILGAIFIDSQASLEACSGFLGKLGMSKLVDRLAAEDDIVLEKRKWDASSSAVGCQ